MRLTCPHCGLRDRAEFGYGGAALPRPVLDRSIDPSAAPDTAWDDYVYRRANPAGPHRELWFHAAGCRTWFAVVRDTRTNEVIDEVDA